MYCKNKGPTVTIIKSQLGLLFGGYTSLNWSAQHDYLDDPNNAFIFSLTKLTKHSNDTKKNSIICYPTVYDENTGFGFGYGDIWISHNSNENANSTSCLGKDYDSDYFDPYSDIVKKYLAGSHNFKVEDIEVYSIIFEA